MKVDLYIAGTTTRYETLDVYNYDIINGAYQFTMLDGSEYEEMYYPVNMFVLKVLKEV